MKQMRILGVDPGIRHTGWAVGTKTKKIASGVIVPPGKKKLFVYDVVPYVIKELDVVIKKYRPDLAAVEEVVWQGRRHRTMFPLAHVAGAIVSWLLSQGISVYLLTPSMKARIRRSQQISEHENDAFALLKVAFAAESKTKGPRSAVYKRKLISIVEKCIHGD